MDADTYVCECKCLPKFDIHARSHGIVVANQRLWMARVEQWSRCAGILGVHVEGKASLNGGRLCVAVATARIVVHICVHSSRTATSVEMRSTTSVATTRRLLI